METSKMTIHRALAELKLIDAKITKAIGEVIPAAIHQKDKKINGHLTQEEFKAQAESKYQQANDLLERKTKIKSAIVASNSVTKVKIGERELTVADAITEKANIVVKKQLIGTLETRHKQVVALLQENNDKVSKNCQIILEHTFGKDNTKVSKDDMEAVRKPFMEQNEFHLFDPLKIEEKINKLTLEVTTFEADVDATLSESNAVTFIQI